MHVVVRLLIVWCVAALLGLSAVVVLAQTSELDLENACVTPRDAHRLTDQTLLARRSLQQLRGALAIYESIPTCSNACQELAAHVDAVLKAPRRIILPDGTGEESDVGRYRFVAEWRARELERLREECQRQARCFVPQIPSTGRSASELLPEEPCPHPET